MGISSSKQLENEPKFYYFMELPKEIQLQIIQFTRSNNPESIHWQQSNIINLRTTCKYFYDLISNEGIYKYFNQSNRPLIIYKRPLIIGRHTCGIMCVAYSPCGKFIASGGKDGTIQIWDAENWRDNPYGVSNIPVLEEFGSVDPNLSRGYPYRRVQSLRDHNNGIGNSIDGSPHRVKSIAYSPCGNFIVSGSKDYIVRIWNLKDGSHQKFHGHKNYITSVAYSPCGNFIVSGSRDQTVRIWNVTGVSHRTFDGPSCGDSPERGLDRSIQTLRGHTNSVISVAYSPCGKFIVSGSADKTVRIWNLADDSHRTFNGHIHSVMKVAYSPCGKFIASGSFNGVIRIWNVKDGTYRIFDGHYEYVCSIAYSPCGKFIVSGGGDKIIRIWNIADGSHRTFRGNIQWVRGLDYSPCGKFIVSGSHDESVKIWRV